MKEHKKVALIITIVLLVIFLPFSILGFIFHAKYIGNNPNHQFHYNNKLWFYDDSGKLIGTYDCNYENCDYAREMILDSTYGINFLNTTGMKTTPLLDNRYAIIADSQALMANEVILYDIVNGKKNTFRGYKIYAIGISNNYVIAINNDNKYGVVQLTESGFIPKIPFEYDFIALQNKRDSKNKRVDGSKFIVASDGMWKLMSASGEELSPSFPNPINSFNDDLIITKSMSQSSDEFSISESVYNLYTYDGTQPLPGDYNLLRFIDNYIEVVDTDNKYYIVDRRTFQEVSQKYDAYDIEQIATKVENNQLTIIISGGTYETIDIN